jgi:hypothetical protein
LQPAKIVGHIPAMKMLCLVLCAAGLASLHADDTAPVKPGFWKRTFQKTKDGVGTVWDATKGVGKKTADVVASPFVKKRGQEPRDSAGARSLAMSMKLEPAKVRLADTRVIEVTVTVANSGKKPVHLEFPSSLRMEVIVKTAGGKIVSRWSDDQPIEKEPSVMLINPRERLEYSAKISTREMKGGETFEIEAYFPGYEQMRVSRTVVPER